MGSRRRSYWAVLCLALHARVELFSGGSNGIDLFYLNLVWFNDDDRIKVF